MPDIRDFKNWIQLSKSYFRYDIDTDACYEIMALRKGDKTEPDCYALYVTGEWRDQDGILHFTRNHICNGSRNECFEAAEKDFKENETKECNPTVTKEDIETLEKFLGRPNASLTLYPEEGKSLVRMILDIYKTVKEKEE